MGVEVRPLGINCNIACQYCYQNPQRDAGQGTKRYDLQIIKSAIEREGSAFALFGGEALLVDEADLEELWAWGLEKYGGNGIQTNGTLINDNHIRMFKQYKVQVGISCDGPEELSDARWAGSLNRTREATAKTERAIARLCEEGMPPSLIVTLHRSNASGDKLPIMHDWFRHLAAIGITDARLHILETESAVIKAKYALSHQENIRALLSFAELETELRTLRFDVFREMQDLLMGKDHYATCVWMGCDPYTTAAVRGIEGTGQSSNCGRTNKDGIDFTKGDHSGYERYLALYHTPQQFGGCNGCRFFLMCKGQCPGTAISGDWRNRTQDCETWMALYAHIEARLVDQDLRPLSLDPNLRYLEQEMLNAWGAGVNPTLQQTLERMQAEAAKQQGGGTQ